MQLTANQARHLFVYDESTGVLSWRHNAGRHGRIKAGTPAGTFSKTDGYLYVRQPMWRAANHRVIWLMVTGDWPAGEIDHMDGNRTNNRLWNLRDVSRKRNAENMVRPRVDSASGLQGVYEYMPGRFRSKIGINGKSAHLGVFNSAAEAHAAFVAAKRQLHPGCTI